MRMFGRTQLGRVSARRIRGRRRGRHKVGVSFTPRRAKSKYEKTAPRGLLGGAGKKPSSPRAKSRPVRLGTESSGATAVGCDLKYDCVKITEITGHDHRMTKRAEVLIQAIIHSELLRQDRRGQIRGARWKTSAAKAVIGDVVLLTWSASKSRVVHGGGPVLARAQKDRQGRRL